MLVLLLAPAALRAQATETNLLPLNATWRYNHADCLDGVQWTATNYNDTIGNWLGGPGGFTGGEANAAALVGVTTQSLPAPNATGRNGRAMYFRTRFNVVSTAALSLIFSNRLDDNAAYYLNGQLVQRVRLSANPILCGSFGDITPHANSDAEAWDVFMLSPAQLAGIITTGTNTLAVEVHQSGSGSSDMVFAMSLTGSYADTNPPPTLRMPTALPAYGYTLVNAFPGASFSAPIAVATPPGETNRLFVLERGGAVTVITNLAAPNRTVVMNLAVTSGCEEGLLGLAFHPGYATNGHFFLFYSVLATTAVPGGTNVLHQRVSRFTMNTPSGNTASAASELVLLTQRDEACNHNGGDLHFGPDGYLYASFGDEGNQNDSFNNSQTIRKDFFSGIIRIDVDMRPGNLVPNPHPSLAGVTNYLVPADNPWVTANLVGELNPGGVKRTEFYAVGLRNPWRFSFDPVTGWLWCGDVGGSVREEVDIIWKGGNYGWAFREGFTTGPKSNTGGGVAINPIIDYLHSGAPSTNIGVSITGGVVYRGSRIPQLTNAYVYGDYGSGNIWAVRSPDGTNATGHQWLLADSGIAAFGRDPSNGDVLAVDIGAGQVKRLTYDTNTFVGTPLPPTLADTGAFTNLMSLASQTSALVPNTGMTAYDINTHFWSDNAHKSRWFFLPGTNKIAFNPDANWSFPTGAAWVKHFDIELTNGVASSARRLETRILVKNAGGVYGVTYRWGNSLTNATLVGENGLDEAFTVYDGGIARTQIWHYPSRNECLTCHTPSGGFALGFNTAQLNRDSDFGSGPTNQLLAMGAAGRFSNPIANVHSLRSLASLSDETVSLEWRVRSYLAANCSQCHVAGGSGLGSFSTAISNTTASAGLIHGALANNGGNPNARVIVPGSPGDSMLLTRISARGAGQMPPLATSLLDTQAIALVSRWITQGLAGYQTFAQWQTNHFGSTNSTAALASADPDMDGASNYEEYISGTEPNEPASFWAVGIQRAGEAVEVTWPRIPNRSVEIQWTSNLFNPAAWQFLNVPANRRFFPASTGSGVVPDGATNGPSKYYRGRIIEP